MTYIKKFNNFRKVNEQATGASANETKASSLRAMILSIKDNIKPLTDDLLNREKELLAVDELIRVEKAAAVTKKNAQDVIDAKEQANNINQTPSV